MILHKTMNDRWLSNSWLVADKPGGHAVVVDTGGPTDEIFQVIEEQKLTLTHVLCTHHHVDHVLHNDAYKAEYGCPVCGHASEKSLFGELDVELAHDEELVVGDMRIRALHIPGHTLGQLAFLIDEEHVFTGDTLFQGSIGGTRGPGHTSYDDIHHSIMDVLMKLPKETKVYPGHVDATTIGREWEENPFVRLWRGVDSAAGEKCTAFGKPATLILRAADYDGGTKCQVRFEETGELDIVPGSQVVTV